MIPYPGEKMQKVSPVVRGFFCGGTPSLIYGYHRGQKISNGQQQAIAVAYQQERVFPRSLLNQTVARLPIGVAKEELDVLRTVIRFWCNWQGSRPPNFC